MFMTLHPFLLWSQAMILLLIGVALSLFHTNFWMVYFSTSVTACGIPCTCERYCVCVPITMFTMRQWPFMVEWLLFQQFRSLSISSHIGDQILIWSILFPTNAPSTLTADISETLSILGDICWWFVCILQEARSDFLYSPLPISRILILLILNFAPEALHHVSRMLLKIHKCVCKSAKRVAISLSFFSGMLKPQRSDFLSVSC